LPIIIFVREFITLSSSLDAFDLTDEDGVFFEVVGGEEL